MFNLFTKFPIIYYSENAAVNILAKIKFNDAVKKASAIYYPYTIVEGERADMIAANYYDDPRYSWLIYLTNDIVDPVHEWPLTEEQFNQHIIKKYGTIDRAVENISYWRVNWYDDDTMLTPAGFAALPSYAKKYFDPTLNATGNIVAYERSKLDYAVETNKIQQMNVSSASGFDIGERIVQKTSGSVTATAYIKHINDNTLTIQHVIGTFANTSGSVGSIVGEESGKSASVARIVTLSTPIPANESVYWTYVNSYDYENEINEQKRHIKLIDKSFIDQIEKELDELL